MQDLVVLALIFIIIIIIIMLSTGILSTLIHVGIVIAALALFWSYKEGKENFSMPGGLPGAAAPYPTDLQKPYAPPPFDGYPGSVENASQEAAAGTLYDNVIYDDTMYRNNYDNDAQYRGGLIDREIDDILPNGNPYNISRSAAPFAAEACIDDEANNNEIDGDERITYQNRSRNDETRVIAGTMNRRRDLDKYFREELEEEEDSRWWGRQEE
jgi:hypothetical protein